MKTKLEMAHEYALEMLKRGDPEWRIVTDSWKLADAMYLENAERENIVCKDLSQEEWQPDWDQAPEDATAWEYLGHNAARWHTTKKGTFRSADLFGYSGVDMFLVERPK